MGLGFVWKWDPSRIPLGSWSKPDSNPRFPIKTIKTQHFHHWSDHFPIFFPHQNPYFASFPKQKKRQRPATRTDRECHGSTSPLGKTTCVPPGNLGVTKSGSVRMENLNIKWMSGGLGVPYFRKSPYILIYIIYINIKKNNIYIYIYISNTHRHEQLKRTWHPGLTTGHVGMQG